ncbi:MAG: dicarboxylate/amino acid:cation symporter [Bdellovibrionota bacterium]
MKSHYKLILALFLGGLLGTVLHNYSHLEWLNQINSHILNPIGQIFLRLIFMVVVPLIFSALVLGVYELGQARGLGRVAMKTIIFTIITSTASVLIGITLVNVFKPGEGLKIDQSIIEQNASTLQTLKENVMKSKPFSQIVVDLFTKNPIDSAARALDGEIVALMLFALLFGIGVMLSSPVGQKNVLIELLERVLQACMKMVELAMKLAPLAVFALVFNSAYKFGFDIFKSLLFYVFVVVLGLLIQQFVVYTAILKAFTNIKPLEFYKNCREVFLYAFSTASSNATLPRTLETAEHKLKLPPQIARFVLTVGSTANQNGTALFEGVTVLFLAQVYGIELALAEQVFVILISILAGIGTAGIPGGSLPPMMILLQAVGIPPEGVGIILGVDRLLDMCRTTINVSGDLVIAAAVSHEPIKKVKLSV